MSAGHYRIFQAEGNLPEPVWPNKPFKELLRIAFRGRTIDNVEHPTVKQCRGLVPEQCFARSGPSILNLTVPSASARGRSAWSAASSSAGVKSGSGVTSCLPFGEPLRHRSRLSARRLLRLGRDQLFP